MPKLGPSGYSTSHCSLWVFDIMNFIFVMYPYRISGRDAGEIRTKVSLMSDTERDIMISLTGVIKIER